MSFPDHSVTVANFGKINHRDWSAVITYMQDHLQERPFHLEEMAQNLHLPLEDVVSVFRMLRGAFQIFHHIQQEKMVQGEDLFSYSANKNKIIQITLTAEEFDLYSTFVYLWEKNHNTPPQLNSNLLFRQLLEKAPRLFLSAKDSWFPSPAGKFFVQQYRKYMKMNAEVPVLEFKQIKLHFE